MPGPHPKSQDEPRHRNRRWHCHRQPGAQNQLPLTRQTRQGCGRARISHPPSTPGRQILPA